MGLNARFDAGGHTSDAFRDRQVNVLLFFFIQSDVVNILCDDQNIVFQCFSTKILAMIGIKI